MTERQDLPTIYRGFSGAENRYAMALLATWREARSKSSDHNWIQFTKEQIVHHGNELHRLNIVSQPLPVKNVPDIIYTFRAREDLPAEIRADGEVAIIGAGKGHYAFAKISQPNRFRLPKTMEEVEKKNTVPQWVHPYMGDDEQGTLTLVAENEIVKDYLGLADAFRLQSHLRMGVPKYGQVEVDEVYAGITKSGEHIIIGVEAKDKGPNDLLNVSQLFGTSQALLHIFPNLPTKKLLGVKPDTNGRVCVCEFSVAKKPSELKPLQAWKAYSIAN